MHFLDITKRKTKLVYALVSCTLTFFGVLLYASTQNAKQGGEIDLPIPLVRSEYGYATTIGGEFSFLVNANIYNKGESGIILVGVRVIYETNGFTKEAFTSVFLGANQSSNVIIIVPGIPLTPCGNSHVIKHQVWCTLP